MKKENIKWLILVICTILFITLTIIVLKYNNLSIDGKFYNIISTCKTDTTTKIFKIITRLGYSYLIIILTITMIYFVLRKKRMLSILIGSNLLIVTLINKIIKNVVKRNRPIGINLIEENGYSFISGHSLASTVLYGYLIYLLYKNVKNKYLKVTLITLLLILIILIYISRIYLGVHYLTDIFGSILLSVCDLIIFTTLTKKYLT